MRCIKIILYTLLLAITTILSCYKPYYPEDLDDEKSILVVQGTITNEPGPYLVQLSWATAFQGEGNEPVEGAYVMLSDDKGNSEVLSEQYSGKYYTDYNGIRGVIGNRYTLNITLQDGTVYRSIPTVMNPAFSYDTIYAFIVKKRSVSQNLSGDIILNEDEGLYTYIDMKLSGTEQRFFRFSTKYYNQYTYENVSTPFPITVYCLSFRYFDQIPNIRSTILYNNEYIIRKHEIGFLKYVFDPRNSTDTTTAPRLYGWILCNTLYSIDAAAYNYYEEVLNQLDNEEFIFDPVPTQITGNMECVSDSTKIALGLFEVASTNSQYAALYWSKGRSDYDMIKLSEVEWFNIDTCMEGQIPEYWISFN